MFGYIDVTPFQTRYRNPRSSKGPLLKHYNQFDNEILGDISDISISIIQPFWTNLDNSLCNVLNIKNLGGSMIHRIFSFLGNFILALFCLPVLLSAFPFWLAMLPFRVRNYRYCEPVEDNSDENASRKSLLEDKGQPKTLKILSANLCLLMELPCRVNMLYNNKWRCSEVIKRILSCPEKFLHKSSNFSLKNSLSIKSDSSSLLSKSSTELLSAPSNRNLELTENTVQTNIPENLDVICFQECFQSVRASEMVKKFSQAGFPYILWDIGNQLHKDLGYDRSFFALENSGLFLASRYPILKKYTKFKLFNNACFGDSMASKGVLLVILEISADSFAIVANTHLQAQYGLNACRIRKKQLKFCYKQMKLLKNDFLSAENNQNLNIKFEILCGDLNFDMKSDPIEASVFEEKGELNQFTDAHNWKIHFPTCLWQPNIYSVNNSKDMMNRMIDQRFQSIDPNDKNSKIDTHHLESEQTSDSGKENSHLILGKTSSNESKTTHDSSNSSNNSSNDSQIRVIDRSISISSGYVTQTSESRQRHISQENREKHPSERLKSNDMKILTRKLEKVTATNEKSSKIDHTRSESDDRRVQEIFNAKHQEYNYNNNNYDLEEQAEQQQNLLFERHPITGIPVKLDYIWFNPEFSRLRSSSYVTAFYGLTDHVPIFAELEEKSSL